LAQFNVWGAEGGWDGTQKLIRVIYTCGILTIQWGRMSHIQVYKNGPTSSEMDGCTGDYEVASNTA
jgi:hypothetical protein